MKGQSTVIPMFALVMLTAISGIAAYGFIEQTPQVLQSNINDLSVISEAETRTEIAGKDYLPVAAIYSVEQASQDLGDKVYSSSQAGSVAGDIQSRLESSSRSNLQVYLDEEIPSCTRQYGDLALKLSQGSENATVELTTSDFLVSTTCADADVEVKYVSGRKKVAAEVWGNRVLAMAENTESVMVEMAEAAEAVEPHQDRGTEFVTCSYSSASAAESAVVAEGEETIESAFDSIESEIISSGEAVETPDQMERRLEVDSQESEKSSSISNVGSSSCSCETDGDSDTTETCYGASAEYSWDYERTAFDIYYQDLKYGIPVSSGWESLEIASTFSHKFS